MQYRREIDGLRALAVLPVILFHANIPGFAGGYIGVDVFFVISGFLITTILADELALGQFSILKFYERRARRILPALGFVILLCIPFAVFWMLPFQLIEFGRSLIGVAVFASNILFWRETGYFEEATEAKPLLHTWSLAVEEQFYILFPLALFVLWRMGPRWIWLGMLAVFALSLGLAETLSKDHEAANFYLLPTRIWELLTGSFVAFYLRKSPPPKGIIAQVGALIGIACVIGSIIWLDEKTPFPSLIALVPVGGTALIILCASSETLTGAILGRRVLVGIGLVSYSAYLWHQPLFAFARLYLNHSPEPVLMIILIVATFVLAWISWRFVETPFRNKARFSRQAIFILSGALLIVMSAIGGLFQTTDGLLNRFTEPQRSWAAMTKDDRRIYNNTGYNAAIKAGSTMDQSVPNLLLIGDSFSRDFYNIIAETHAFEGYRISGTRVSPACQIYAMENGKGQFQSNLPNAHCERYNIDAAALAQADVVILSFSWYPWAAQRLPETIKNLGLRADQKLLVIGPKSLSYNLRQLVRQDLETAVALRVSPSASHIQTNQKLRSLLPADIYVDVIATMCDTQNLCPVVTPQGGLIAHDGYHVTPQGAAFLGDRLFRTRPLSPFLPPQN